MPGNGSREGLDEQDDALRARVHDARFAKLGEDLGRARERGSSRRESGIEHLDGIAPSGGTFSRGRRRLARYRDRRSLGRPGEGRGDRRRTGLERGGEIGAVPGTDPVQHLGQHDA